MCRSRFAALLLLSVAVPAQETYKKPPKEILDVLHAPTTPQPTLSPGGDMLLLCESRAYPPIAEVAQPMLRLAGVRINPRNNGPHMQPYSVGLRLQKIADGSEIKVSLPANARIWSVEWSPDGKRFAFLNATSAHIELWVGDRTGQTRRLPGNISTITRDSVRGAGSRLGDPLRWMPDSRTLLVTLVPAGRGLQA